MQSAAPSWCVELPGLAARGALFATVCLFVFGAVQMTSAKYTLTEARRALYQDYKEVQLWAKASTEPTDIFMPDPCSNYGWRDFSQRSSWGALSEFLKTGWLYTSNRAVFEEGLARAKRLKVDSRAMLAKDPTSIRQNFRNVCRTARRTYYAQNPAWMKAMASDYDIGYFVFLKRHAANGPVEPPVFENESFFVLDAAALMQL